MEGKIIYTQKCVSCHGENGKLGLGDAADLTTSAMDPGAMVENIQFGKGMMPGFKDQLNEKQVDAVVDYVQTLRK